MLGDFRFGGRRRLDSFAGTGTRARVCRGGGGGGRRRESLVAATAIPMTARARLCLQRSAA